MLVWSGAAGCYSAEKPFPGRNSATEVEHQRGAGRSVHLMDNNTSSLKEVENTRKHRVPPSLISNW